MGRKYPQITDGQWVAPVKKGYRMRCCDCGLVHVMEFTHVPARGRGRKIIFRAWRDERATAASRRKQKD